MFYVRILWLADLYVVTAQNFSFFGNSIPFLWELRSFHSIL